MRELKIVSEFECLSEGVREQKDDGECVCVREREREREREWDEYHKAIRILGSRYSCFDKFIFGFQLQNI